MSSKSSPSFETLSEKGLRLFYNGCQVFINLEIKCLYHVVNNIRRGVTQRTATQTKKLASQSSRTNFVFNLTSLIYFTIAKLFIYFYGHPEQRENVFAGDPMCTKDGVALSAVRFFSLSLFFNRTDIQTDICQWKLDSFFIQKYPKTSVSADKGAHIFTRLHTDAAFIFAEFLFIENIPFQIALMCS